MLKSNHLRHQLSDQKAIQLMLINLEPIYTVEFKMNLKNWFFGHRSSMHDNLRGSSPFSGPEPSTRSALARSKQIFPSTTGGLEEDHIYLRKMTSL